MAETMKPTRYRLYVDEVGNPSFKPGKHEHDRYLSLTGVMMAHETEVRRFALAVEAPKVRHFDPDPDEPLILHRKELLHKEGIFGVLRDPVRCTAFDADLMQVLVSTDFTVMTVTLDKLEYRTRYGRLINDPYHICFAHLLGQFADSLESVNGIGDVMVERRGLREDRRLKTAFRELTDQLEPWRPASGRGSLLSSNDLKFKGKLDNVPGLQLADLVAYPCFRACLQRFLEHDVAPGFGQSMIEMLVSQKIRKPAATDERVGWGITFLP